MSGAVFKAPARAGRLPPGAGRCPDLASLGELAQGSGGRTFALASQGAQPDAGRSSDLRGGGPWQASKTVLADVGSFILRI